MMRAAVLLALALSGPAVAAPMRGTLAYDFRNIPVVSRLEGFETVVFSARGSLDQAKVDSVRAWGGKVLALVQPTLAAWNGVPADQVDRPWDRSLWESARANGGPLVYPDGATVWMFAGQPYAAAVWDLTNAKQVDAMAEIVAGLNVDGIVLDYGCPWLDVSPWPSEAWPAWIEGWRALVDQVRARRPAWQIVCQCDQLTASATPARCDGLLLERVGQALNPPGKVWQQVTSDPESRFLLRQEDGTPSRRRLFAGIALVTNGLFSQTGDPNKTPSLALKNIEHWDLSIGLPGASWWERQPGIYQRQHTRGLAIVNLSHAPLFYAYNKSTTFTIAPNDGLVLQTRDTKGRYISVRSNSGR